MYAINSAQEDPQAHGWLQFFLTMM